MRPSLSSTESVRKILDKYEHPIELNSLANSNKQIIATIDTNKTNNENNEKNDNNKDKDIINQIDNKNKIIENNSISQTLSRNVYSTLTTFVTVLMLNIMGVASLKEFTFTLMAGLICGMYSSIFITGPLWMVLRKYVGKKEDKAKAAKAKKTA